MTSEARGAGAAVGGVEVAALGSIKAWVAGAGVRFVLTVGASESIDTVAGVRETSVATRSSVLAETRH